MEYTNEFVDSPYCKEEYFGTLDMPFPSPIDELHVENSTVTPEVLINGPQKDTVDLDAYRLNSTMPADSLNRSPLWSPVWRGYYTQSTIKYYMNDLQFNVPPLLQGAVEGRGADTYGPFTIEGKRNGSQIVFEKDYPTYAWKYKGTINAEGDVFEGHYGWYGEEVDENGERIFMPAGEVQLERMPIYRWSHRPHKDTFIANKYGSLWRFALDAVLHSVRVTAGGVPWTFFEERRARRTKYLELIVRLHNAMRDQKVLTSEAIDCIQEVGALEQTFSYADVRFYRSLSGALARRAIVHRCASHSQRMAEKLNAWFQ